MTENPGLPGVLRQFGRFGVVGVAVNVAGYLLYLALTALSLDYRVAATLTFVAGMGAGYLLNSHWTFSAAGRSWNSLARYGAVYGAAYVVYIVGLWVSVDVAGADHRIAPLAFMVMMPPLVFLLQKVFVFSKP